MTAIQKISGLSQPQLSFLIHSIAKDKDLQEVKTNFQAFFVGINIDGDLLLQIAAKYKTEIENLIPKYEYYIDDLTSFRKELLMINHIQKESLKPQVVNVTKLGEAIEKIDYPTALRCSELKLKLLMYMKEHQMVTPSTLEESEKQLEHSGPTYKMQIVHN